MYREVEDVEVGYGPPMLSAGVSRYIVQQPIFGIVNIAHPRHTNDVYTPIYELRPFDLAATDMFDPRPTQATDLPLLPDQFSMFDYGYIDPGDNMDVIPMRNS